MQSRQTNGTSSSRGFQNGEPADSLEYASLIIRLWHGTGGEAGGENSGWRSEVEHIQSGGVWDYSSLAELECFLEDFLRQLGGSRSA